jgi:hypothetical protein
LLGNARIQGGGKASSQGATACTAVLHGAGLITVELHISAFRIQRLCTLAARVKWTGLPVLEGACLEFVMCFGVLGCAVISQFTFGRKVSLGISAKCLATISLRHIMFKFKIISNYSCSGVYSSCSGWFFIDNSW